MTAISVSSKVFERYSHYETLRCCVSLFAGNRTCWQIQGWNGKRWVRAKARKGTSSRRPKKGYVYAVL